MNITDKTACPACGEGRLLLLTRDFLADIGDGQKLRIPNIEMEVCDQCGEEILSLKSAREVDAAIEEFSERLAPAEMREIRERLGVDQTEMSEILGLGGKTFHRWEKGNQYPSRSMGYYLRVLREFPEAFQWLRSRGWKGRNRLVTQDRSPITEKSRMFPALAGNPERLKAMMTNRINFARILLP